MNDYTQNILDTLEKHYNALEVVPDTNNELHIYDKNDKPLYIGAVLLNKLREYVIAEGYGE